MDIAHRSVPNRTEKARFNLQVRLSNINDSEFCKRYLSIKSKMHKNLSPEEQNLLTYNYLFNN